MTERVNSGHSPGLEPMAVIQRLSVCIAVSNLEETAKWYVETLGFRVVQQQDFPSYSSRIAFLESRGFRIELVETNGLIPDNRADPPAHTQKQGLTQLSFKVNDIETAYEEAKKRDLTIALDLITVDAIGIKAFFIRDHEGNLIEFIEEI